MASDYQATTSRPRSTDTQNTTTRDLASSSQGQADIREKRSLLDELLPVPVTEQSHPAHSQGSIHNSVRRIVSLGIIVVFLLTITFYGTTLIGDESTGMKSSMKSVVGGFVKSVGGSMKGVQDDVSEGMEQLKLEDGKDDTTPVQTGVWDDAPISDITVQPMDGISDDSMTAASHPDWAKYTFLRTVPPSALPLEKPKKRIIFVGDVHGSLHSLKKLMKKLSYDPSLDLLIHVGDILAKGPDSIGVVEYLRTHKAKGVRGNHDEKVIEWRSWMRWAGKGYQSSKFPRDSTDGHKGWRAFIDDLDAQFPSNTQDEELSKEQQEQLEASLAAKAKSFPKGWTWRSEHWRIARRLAKDDYQYLVDLPLTLHLPSLHSIVVHAGLLARDPTKKATSENQPYASAISTMPGKRDDALTRSQSELALLQTIPQNRDPYTLLNIRSVLKDGKVTKKANKGTPWSEIWHEEMSRCTGAGSDLVEDEEEGGSTNDDEGIERTEENEKRALNRKKESKTLPKMDCSPVTVIYGHAAGRGLDIKKYSKGLDSGCVYGKQLTALVLGDVKATKKIKGAKPVRVGSKKGVLIDIECEKATSGNPE